MSYVRENVPLSRFGILVAQLESIVVSSAQQSPDATLCFDLLSDLLSSINEEPKESILLWQRKCEDTLYSLLIHGACRPVRHLASVALANIIMKGDNISIYSRASSLQAFLSDVKHNEPQQVAGAAQCLGEIYHLFGRKITSGLLETSIIATKLIKFHEEFVRQEALHMLENALEGSNGTAAFSAYNEAFRLLMRFGISDKSFIVRIAAARCLKTFANIGGPSLSVGELDNSVNCCVKALEDPVSSVRDAFAEALAALLALGLNPNAHVQPKGKGDLVAAKKIEGGLQRHLVTPFLKANGTQSKDLKFGLMLSWVFFLQAIQMKYCLPDAEIQNFALEVMSMLHVDASVDTHALACVVYILRVGVTDQMLEPTQRDFLVFLGNQLQSFDGSPSMKLAALSTLSYTLKTLGEVPHEFKVVLDNTIVASLSDSSQLVRIEAALTLRALAEVDPTSVGDLVSYGVTILNALRENVSFVKESNLRVELDSLHGQATALAALVTMFPKLPLGYPARLPRSVLEVSKKMLTECRRNLMAATVEKEAGWLLLAALLASIPKEELEDQVFDILSLWAPLFGGNHEPNETGDIIPSISVCSAAVDALTAFVRCFDSPGSLNNGILFQPVVVYLSRALYFISLIAARELVDKRPATNILIIRTLVAYQSLSNPMSYRTEHPQIIQICTTPFRDAPRCAESSCLRSLLDKRDAWLGPWIPGRNWFEDELRAFEGGKDGLMPCIWNNELAAFPQETIHKMVINQMLLSFGVLFASQDSSGMLSLLGLMEQCLKFGKKQSWYWACVTNISVGLLAGLKALISVRFQPLELDVLNSAQTIFLGILSEGDICASQRRAASEGLGLLARLGNDLFTARMTRLLLCDLTGSTDPTYAGSIAFTLGCIHRCAGGMALSSLVPSTVNSISNLAKSSIAGLKIWSLHGLLLIIEAAGLSFVSHVQATLGLAMDILLSDENGWLDLQQGVGRLINACVAVLGPELSPGSIFFSRCKSVVAEISYQQETAMLLEHVRFTQQLVLFAPHAVSVHTHVKTLLPTLCSKHPTLRHLAVSTLRHLIEKDVEAIIGEEVEYDLFHMLDEETDSEIGCFVRTTIMRLLYASSPLCPSRWIFICRKLVLATSARSNSEAEINTEHNPYGHVDGNVGLSYGEDDENMVSSSKNNPKMQGRLHVHNTARHLRFRTRIFAAECLSHLPMAVGENPVHFDLTLAREQQAGGGEMSDLLVLQLQELISLAYQISTLQFESMQSIGVGLLSTIIGKFEMIPDPEIPGHLLMEQYQAQLVSAIRTSLNQFSGPVLLEAGMRLATKVLTSGIISGDQAAIKRIFSLISRPLDDYKDLHYPSFAEWVSCKVKVRLLAAHASLKCYIFTFLKKHQTEIPDEFVALAPLFLKSSSILRKYWIFVLKDYCYICFHLHPKRNWKPFLDEIQSPGVASKLQPCLGESWSSILQALALDAVPANSDTSDLSRMTIYEKSLNPLISGYSLVELEHGEFHFLWGFTLLALFQGQDSMFGKQILSLSLANAKFCRGGDSPEEMTDCAGVKLYEIVLPVFRFLSAKSFFDAGFFTFDICKELVQVFSYSISLDEWNRIAISVIVQIVQGCPDDFFENEDFVYSTMELCSSYLFKVLECTDATLPENQIDLESTSLLLQIAKTLIMRFDSEKKLKSVFPLLLTGFECLRVASSENCISKVNDFIQCIISSLKKQYDDQSKRGDGDVSYLETIVGSCLNVIACFTRDAIKGIHEMCTLGSGHCKLLQMKLALSLEQTYLFAKLAHEIELPRDSKNTIRFDFYLLSTKCFREVFDDSDSKVLLVVLQVLKNLLQRGTNLENNFFLLSFSGELLGDIFLTLHKILEKPLTHESVALIGEFLRILLLLRTLSRVTECHKTIMELLLEAILLVFSASENNASQEANDIRSIVVKLVSHLAQIPSEAAQLKDVLLGMPLIRRQQLQGIVRASVTQENVATHTKSNAPILTIKLPSPPNEITETASSPATNAESETEEEDNWETFQSFPASANSNAEEINPNSPSPNEALQAENPEIIDLQV